MLTLRVGALCVALLTVVTLSGCGGADEASQHSTPDGLSTHDGLSTDDREVAQAQLVSSLEQVSSVEAVTVMPEPRSPSLVRIEVLVTHWVEEDVLVIVESVASTAESPLADGSILAAGIYLSQQGLSSGRGLYLTFPLSLSTDVFASEIHYWFALMDSYPDTVWMSLSSHPSASGAPYEREIGTVGLIADWDAFRAVPDVSGASRTWSISQWSTGALPPDILSASGTLPPDDVIALYDAIRSFDQEPDFTVDVRYSDAPQSISVSLKVVLADEPDLTLSPRWPQLVDTVQRILDLGFERGLFQYVNDAGGAVHFGPCGDKGTWTVDEEGDQALWEALDSADLVLPAGSGAGVCN